MIRWEEKQDECYSSLFIASIYLSELKSQSVTHFPYQLQVYLPMLALSPGGNSAYERDGDARRNFELNP